MLIKKILKNLILLVFSLVVFLLFLFKFNFVFISGNSGIDNGFYTFQKKFTYEVGDLVVVCLNNNNKWLNIAIDREYIPQYSLYCKKGGTISKRIAGSAGDRVLLTNKGVFINNRFIEKSTIQAVDGKNRELKKITTDERYTIKPNEFYLTSAKPREFGFDSRYFGMVSQADILGAIKKVF